MHEEDCDALRASIQSAKLERNGALTANAQADDAGRGRPHSDLDLARRRAAIELAAGAARMAGCYIDDLVGPAVGLPKEAPDSEIATDRCREVRMVIGPTAGTIISDAVRGYVLRAVRAVQSRAPHGMVFVAAELLDPTSTSGERGMFGLWAADAIDRPTTVVAVEAVAISHSSLPDAGSAGLTVRVDDDGADEALNCARRVRIG